MSKLVQWLNKIRSCPGHTTAWASRRARVARRASQFHVEWTRRDPGPTNFTGCLTITPYTGRQVVLEQANGLLLDSDIWPTKQSYYYLGITPNIKLVGDTVQTKSLRTRLLNVWHTSSIRLAARIWGEALQSATKAFHLVQSRSDESNNLESTIHPFHSQCIT
ncbi:hypothetical protein CVT26_007878 [Gymnopilus dilepis]|uniref:Uncharacterized protein n=1 Tax=Gymnopilus dilepis TaxID=231916 RepID=A0A409YKA6_9AGAR|nr:hypothetical protein CVT26_007878 [Gymnopilus dilepis]